MWGRLVVLMLYAMGTGTASGQPRQPFTVWVVDSLTPVRPVDPPGSVTTLSIKAARNESEAAQLVISAPRDRPMTNVNVSVSNLGGPGLISTDTVRLYRSHYVPVRTPSQWKNWRSPNRPGLWPDVLIPFNLPGGTYESAPFTIRAGHNQPVWIEVHVPRNAAAGIYRGSATVTADAMSPVTIPLNLTVWDFTLPDRPFLASEFGVYDREFARAANVIGANQAQLRASLYAALDAHRLGIGWARLDAATDAWMRTHRHVQAPGDYPGAQLHALRAKPWGDLMSYYIADEPRDAANYAKIRTQAVRWRALRIPTMATIQNDRAWVALDGAIDTWVVVHYMMIPQAASIRARLARGDRVWSYTAGLQPNDVPTWELDYDPIHYRIPAWLNYHHGLTGILYWATARWSVGDPWTNAANENLEGVLFYPGTKVGAPHAAIPSVRLKAIRDGIDDYDYLALIAALGDPEFARHLATALAPAWDNWSHDPDRLARARERAAQRIVELQASRRGD